MPRFRIGTLMIAVAVVGLLLAAVVAVNSQRQADVRSGMVLRSNYWIEVSPPGWLGLACFVGVVVGRTAARIWAIRED